MECQNADERMDIHVFGDSHGAVFGYLNDQDINRRFRFKMNLIGGATAQGLRNPNSLTNAVNYFKEKIDACEEAIDTIFSLGEVDTGFVIWYRSEKYSDSIGNQLMESLSAYYGFLLWVKRRKVGKIFVLSAPLPTIMDGQDFGEVANLRREVKASQWERTNLTLAYNRNLQAFCAENGMSFISCDSDLLDFRTGLIRTGYLREDRTDHHLKDEKYSPLVYKKLSELVDKASIPL